MLLWGVSGLLIPSRGSAPHIIMKVRDLGTVIPTIGIRKHNGCVILKLVWGTGRAIAFPARESVHRSKNTAVFLHAERP